MTGEFCQVLGVGVGEEQARRAVAIAAEDWGGEWDPDKDRLALAVTAGLRIGWVQGPVRFERPASGKPLEVCYKIEESRFALQRAAVALLSVGAAGGLFTMVWPFFAHTNPGLLELAPLAALFALGGWFLVVSRLRNAGPEDFLAAAAKIAGE